MADVEPVQAPVGPAVRLLGPDDVDLLQRATARNGRYGLERDDGPGTPPPLAGARAFLTDPAVLVWVAEAGEIPIGVLHCFVQRRRTAGPWAELLLYDIGVDEDVRGRGIGRALLNAMESWMAEHGVVEVWVPADDEAIGFYAACGYELDHTSRVMTRSIG